MRSLKKVSILFKVSDIFKYLWSDNKEKVNDDIFEKVVLKYLKVKEIQDCINDFREIFDKKAYHFLMSL